MGILDKLTYKLRKRKYCKYCGNELVTDEEYRYSERTGLPTIRYVAVRCTGFCFRRHGYLYRWSERVKPKWYETWKF